jgi:hypothetical protein
MIVPMKGTARAKVARALRAPIISFKKRRRVVSDWEKTGSPGFAGTEASAFEVQLQVSI